jgi:hypothetical protein
MEQSGRNGWQPVAKWDGVENGSNARKSLACVANRLPIGAHGKEGRRFESVRGLYHCGVMADQELDRTHDLLHTRATRQPRVTFNQPSSAFARGRRLGDGFPHLRDVRAPSLPR